MSVKGNTGARRFYKHYEPVGAHWAAPHVPDPEEDAKHLAMVRAALGPGKGFPFYARVPL